MSIEYVVLLTSQLLCVYNVFGGRPMPQAMLENLSRAKTFSSRGDVNAFLESELDCDDLYAFRLEGGVRYKIEEGRVYHRN